MMKQVVPNISSAQCQAIFYRLDKQKAGTLDYDVLLTAENQTRLGRVLHEVMSRSGHKSKRHRSKRKRHSEQHQSTKDKEPPELVRTFTDPHTRLKTKKKKHSQSDHVRGSSDNMSTTTDDSWLLIEPLPLTNGKSEDIKKKLLQLCQECDEDKTGIIDTDEFKRVILKVLPKAKDENIMTDIFHTFELDNTGMVNYHQLLNRTDFDTLIQQIFADEHKELDLIIESPKSINIESKTKSDAELKSLKEEKQSLLKDNLSLKGELERLKKQQEGTNSTATNGQSNILSAEFVEALLNPNKNGVNLGSNKKDMQQSRQEAEMIMQPQQKRRQSKTLEINSNNLREPLLGEESTDKNKDSDKEMEGTCGCLKFW